MISKTKIDRKASKKTNSFLVETIILAKKQKAAKWVEIANLLALPRRQQIIKNLDEIEKQCKEGDTIIVPGKVLGKGDVSKRIRISAFSYSQEAREKLKAKKSEIVSIADEIKKNPKAEGIKVLS